ncbi:MAG: protein translocase subunit SecF [Patescibacteria group bacterium]|nr:protein translocase subunit SecF [Patescibacteria group bacterium]
MKKFLTWQLIAIFVMATVLGFVSIPYEYQSKFLPSGSEFLSQTKINLGLDLQGGTQLDYKIDLRKVESADQESIVEGVKEVITRRVNGLGVSEPNIYMSHIADEYHIVVELAGIKDIEEAKATVGKTIQLEFKEKAETIDEGQKEERRQSAEVALARILAGEDFESVGSEEELAYPTVVISTSQALTPLEEIAPDLQSYISGLEPGDIATQLIEGVDGLTYDWTGEIVDLEGYFLLEVTDHQFVTETGSIDKEVKASHILIGWNESALVSDRTKKEAKALAEEVLEKAKSGEDFATLAEEYSEDLGTATAGGDLGFFGPGEMVPEFEEAAFNLEIGKTSEIVETKFGYHIIQVTDIKGATSEEVTVEKYALNKIIYQTLPDPWLETELTGEHFVRADVMFTQAYMPYVSILFNDEGAELFEKLTAANVDKPLAIFVGGNLISAPTVREKITGGSAQITGDFTVEEASALARDLNTGAIPAPIVLSGQYTIGASLGAEALATSVKAGIIGLLILGLYLLLYYRLPGLLANIALIIYAIILLFAIKIALPLPLAILIALFIFGGVVAAILKSSDSGGEKSVSFLIACFVLFFLTFVFASPLTLTLAGIAGVILSIGMAVDANVLIFERIKEELRAGKPYALSIETGFTRAWDSIRDSNFSSLITCAILLYFGSSIIRGFAFNLALGILISMFTAITITRTFLRSTVGKKALESDFLFGINKKRKPFKFDFIGKSKLWATFSGVLIAIALIAIPLFGLNLGLDFTGGTLMEVKFDQEEITTSNLSETLANVEGELLSPTLSEVTEMEITGEESVMLSGNPDDTIEFGTPLIVETGDGSFIIRIKHISEETHEYILSKFEENYGTLEEVRFTTVGPTIGETLKKKAVIALGLALVMIVLYIAFAFRKVPAKIGPWRFGLCAIAALAHDTIIILGIFVLLGKFMGVEVDALFVTALLTIIGFSVHDTIVVFDRTRENLRVGDYDTFKDTANAALNQTLARSINTSISTLFTIVALFIWGAASIHFFVLALILGILVGTYSSIFVATPLLVWWHNKVEKE